MLPTSVRAGTGLGTPDERKGSATREKHNQDCIALIRVLILLYDQPLLLLAPISFLPALTSKVSAAYFIGAVLLCASFLYYGARFALRKSNSSARQLLSASITYLPSLVGLMMVLRW